MSPERNSAVQTFRTALHLVKGRKSPCTKVWTPQRNTFTRSELAIQGKELIAKKAEERKRGGQGGVLLNQKSDEAKEINTNKELAKIAGVSHDTRQG